MNRALAKVADWMLVNGLKLAVHKTEAVIMTSKREFEEPTFLLDGVIIRSVDKLK